MIDSQSVKTTESGGPRGYDAAKKGKGRKRHIVTDTSVCTTWGVKGKHLFLIGLFRRRLEYPDLKRAVRDQQNLFGANEILIEDRASGTQLILDLLFLLNRFREIAIVTTILVEPINLP